MLHFEGEKTLKLDDETCWAKLSDPRFLGQCVPNLESTTQPGPDQVQLKVRPGVSFVRGTLEITIKVEKSEPRKTARYYVQSRAIGSSSDAEAILMVEPATDGTRLRWTVNIKTLNGLLKAVPQGLIKASAQKVITDLWMSVENKLNKNN
jgi:carbon monoxide dehydrogenase subunit G